jgi:hypothetical protein
VPSSFDILKLLLILVVAVLASSLALAQPPANDKFAEAKQRRLQRIDELRTCVANSKDLQQMRDCKPERKGDGQS